MAHPLPRTFGVLLLLLTPAWCAGATPAGEAAAVWQRFAGAPVWVVGERHRVASSHRLFAGLVARSLSVGEQVLVGLEIPADRQAKLDAALAGGDAAVAPVVIDCPSYRQLLVRLGALAAAHPGQLRVRAIDVPGDSRAERDRYMSGVLGAAVRPGRRVLALVGNLHAWKGEGSGRLAARLRGAGVKVASLFQLGTGRNSAGSGSGLLEPSSAPARGPLLALAELVDGGEPRAGAWSTRATDAVLLRP